MKIKSLFFVPRIIDIGPDLLELFENVTCVRFLNHSVLESFILYDVTK